MKCLLSSKYQGCLPRHDGAIPACTSHELSPDVGHRHPGYLFGVSQLGLCPFKICSQGNLLKNENKLDLI